MIKHKTVLVISDRQEQFSTARSLLQKDGYSVVFKNDTCNGLKLVETFPLDLIISELADPDIDGLELCTKVKGDISLGSTPVVLIGDLSRQSTIVEDGLRCGAVEYLQKPFDELKLVELCREIVGPKAPDPEPERTDNLFNSIMANTTDVIMIVDIDGMIIYESPSTKPLLGYELGALTGVKISELVHPSDINEFEEFLGSIHWDYGTVPKIEFRIHSKDDSWKMIETSGSPITDARFGSAVVLTLREKHDEVLNFDNVFRNDTLRAAFINGSGKGVAMFSPSGHLIDSNPALLRLLDYSKNELADMALSEFVYPADPSNDRRALEEVLCGKRPHYRFENGYLSPLGERIWGTVTVMAIPDEKQNLLYLIAMFEEPNSENQSNPVLYDHVVSEATYGTPAHLLDFNQWKIGKGLMCKN